MSLIGNVIRYPVIPLIVKGLNADSKELDKAHKEFSDNLHDANFISEFSKTIKEDMPQSLKFMAEPIASTFIFIGKRSPLQVGGALGAIFGGLGFVYGSSPGSWFREKVRVVSDYMYEKTKPVFHWGGAALGTVGLCSVGAGYFLKKSVDNSAGKKYKEDIV